MPRAHPSFNTIFSMAYTHVYGKAAIRLRHLVKKCDPNRPVLEHHLPVDRI